MAGQARVQIINEVTDGAAAEHWSLCYQWCRYIYDDGRMEMGFRFIWRRPVDRSLQAARGQARIPSAKVARELMKKADDAGWGHNVAES